MTRSEREIQRKVKVLKLYRFICAYLRIPGLPKYHIKCMNSYQLQQEAEKIICELPRRKRKKLEKFIESAKTHDLDGIVYTKESCGGVFGHKVNRYVK
jgi:hypothetical protein